MTNLKELHQQYVMPTYAPGLTLVRGEGAVVWDDAGREYLDFSSGIAVCGTGHCHPAVVAAIREQAGKLIHCSNLFHNELQPRLAQKISALGLGGKVFFGNSGAEANEALFKLARKWGSATGRYEIITMKNSFHGRTLATMTATVVGVLKRVVPPVAAMVWPVVGAMIAPPVEVSRAATLSAGGVPL